MVILDVQLWELRTQRLHQGLSETILVNTLLTDVREFKNTKKILIFYSKIDYYIAEKVSDFLRVNIRQFRTKTR